MLQYKVCIMFSCRLFLILFEKDNNGIFYKIFWTLGFKKKAPLWNIKQYIHIDYVLLKKFIKFIYNITFSTRKV